MKKHELLVPAGNMDCLRQAVMNGCDAVYLACKNFGARKFANNFDQEEIVEAIRYCHLYGVRIYVTMNTLIKNSEVEDFISQARFLHQQGVDALIVQDFGMICLLREMFPNLEIHASTQANISSKDVCELYHQLGVKRVVFSRELSIDEIDSIDVPIEKEAFIHGALCISYSGCCLMSSMLGGRSGNRGECAGVCRMPFSLYEGNQCIEKEKYLLSTKELNTSSRIKRLLESSIDSFKIEGRMKSPFYVGFITRLYRKLIDGETIDLVEEEKKLKTIFNREFTVGRMFREDDYSFMNTKSPNHVGYPIGKVVDVKDKIKIQLNPGEVLHQEDAIRFMNAQEGFVVNYLYDEKGKFISSSDKTCLVDHKVSVKVGDIVSKTQDFLLQKEYENLPKRKVSVSFFLKAHVGEKIFLSLTDGVHSVSLEGDIVEKAKTSPMDSERIQKQLGKLGDTPFLCTSCEFDIEDSIFLSIQVLNEMRRKLVEELIQEREKSSIPFVENKVSFEKKEDTSLTNLYVQVSNQEQFDACMELKVPHIIVSDSSLHEKNQEMIYSFPRCQFSIRYQIPLNCLVSDYANYKKHPVIGGYPLNVFNIYTAYYLEKIGVSPVTLSVELSEEEIYSFIEEYQKKFGKKNFLVFSYGRVENMIIKGNILQLKEKTSYSLKDTKNREFPCFWDGRCTHILNCDVYSLHLKNVSSYLYFYEETGEEVKRIVLGYLN